MTIMIYNKKEITYNEDYDKRVTHNRFLFTNEDAYTWNRSGDEYIVEPSYAEGCMWQSVLESKEVRKIIEIFDDKYDWELPSMNWDENLNDIPITSTEFGGYGQRGAQEDLPQWKAIIDNLPTLFKQSPRRWRDLHFQWNDYDHYGGYIHEVHILTGFTEDAFNPDNFKAINKTAKTYRDEKWAKEEEEYYASEQYEKDRQEDARRMSELKTTMYENGFTSYADNGDGTYTVW